MILKNYKNLILILLLQFCLHINATDIYVAKNGDDSNSGTIESPLLTISKAASIAVAGDVVYIREGTYEETLAPANSGTAGNPIIFQSYPGERVIISAMESLSGWSQDSGAIYKTTIPFTSLGQQNFVMHQETALDLARWPNKTDQDAFALNSLRNSGGSASDVINNAYLTESSIPNINWTDGAVWFYGDKPGSGWIAWKAKITSSSSGRVNFNLDKNPDWIRTFHAPADFGDFYLEGVKGALDYQNEWYFNPSTKELFVQLPSGAAPADGDVKMRRRNETINLKHKKYIEVRNLAVFGGGITLEDDTRWTTNSNTTNNVLYGISSFYGAYTQGIVTGFNTGVAAIKMEGSNNTIEKCEIAYGSATGINVRGNYHTIKNNLIHDFNTLGSYDAPVVLRGMHNSKFINNQVSKGGRDGINYSGTNNEIAYNDISRSNLIADDCALFYTVGKQENTEIHHNWFHDNYSRGDLNKAAGIYLDNDAESFKVHHNVVWNTEWTNIQINWNGKDLEIYNNTLWNGSEVMGAWHKEGTSFTNVKVWNNLGSDNNWEPESDKQNNLVVSSDVFANVSQGDFTLNSDSEPIDKGREITGITDGFLGDHPDVGAYEFGGENWVAGTDWDPTYGPADLGCYGLPGEVCSDLPADDKDLDGVVDSLDLCPDTPRNTTVNADGCAIFTIAADNFTVLTKGETCASSDNGSIAITSKENSLTFTATIEGTSMSQTFTSDVEFTNLTSGNYTLCITTDADANYKQCYNIIITAPEDLSVAAKVNENQKSIALNLTGSELYRINLNGVITVTDQENITLPLKTGENNIKVSTDKDCQGNFQEKVILLDEILVYPSIVKENFTIAFPENQTKNVSYQVMSSTGKIVLQKSFQLQNRNILVATNQLSAGVYFVKVTGNNMNSNFKIIKQ
ncbi:hypothetical protein BW723_03885 [Polaribacter reichenbachii]|uniref:Secretion system C-terminal sorting domain-containing protein n=1 Tax=Polaribacter reichenbachii TaxID=996801 RepID=A0A1B8TVJ2_9FLAO|nr:right-handed parallel beta-helix repeat-containing protein [Polaribacter reichenbachii]APZ45489.1 hypothetical protein BW723_03885 [Polaribacter reichenbachii]AUC19350.1 hypothetical protein BTO17_11890 [Polaribacter reichenbachii]OBY63495.1 hypothetical protein LPB301_11820 [Polaribacter reichenbachii]